MNAALGFGRAELGMKKDTRKPSQNEEFAIYPCRYPVGTNILPPKSVEHFQEGKKEVIPQRGPEETLLRSRSRHGTSIEPPLKPSFLEANNP